MLTAGGSTVLTASESSVGPADARAWSASATAGARCGSLRCANQALKHLVRLWSNTNLRSVRPSAEAAGYGCKARLRGLNQAIPDDVLKNHILYK